LKQFDHSIARAARAYTGLGQIELATAAKVASRTIYRLEKDGSVTQDSLEKILRALQKEGVNMLYNEAGQVYGMTFKIR
jgi:DNA-binding XRE family transcriptional regulator